MRCTILIAACGALAAGCFGAAPRPDRPASIGAVSSGYLHRGVPLAQRGRGYVLARPGDETRFGTPRLVAALERALASVQASFAGSLPTRVGDLSSPNGGRHPRHGSHRAGRDVDVLFFVTDPIGRPAQSRGWVAFSRYGHAFDVERGETLFFDDARNWHLVRTLLLDGDAEVQWIFVSRGLKTRLLDYALAHEPSADALIRAAYVLHQPENARPHDDHFHLRVFCTREERAAGCRDVGPRWPWLRPDVEAIAGQEGPGLDDASLLDQFLDGADPAASSTVRDT